MSEKTAISLSYQPGSLVEFRDRPWMILNNENQLLKMRALGGTEKETIEVYTPITKASAIKSYTFSLPELRDIGKIDKAQLFYQALRLSFRQITGPFRSLGKYSFRPRAYQMVPLIMALQQDIVRLLIADDVGIGKTIEALMIAKEMIDRGQVKRLTILCLPHLCEQWQNELKQKFGLSAVVIRSGNIKQLEKNLLVDQSIFEAYPIQVVSIDYMKLEANQHMFLAHQPDLLIVDEVHTCGSQGGQHHRHDLLKKILKLNPKLNLLLLSATPHSGIEAHFQSILGFLSDDFAQFDIKKANQEEKERLSKHFIQRKRSDISKCFEEETVFPKRDSLEIVFKFHDDYLSVFNDLLNLLRGQINTALHQKRKIANQKYHYWQALALLRGLMSSPYAALLMLSRKVKKSQSESEITDNAFDLSPDDEAQDQIDKIIEEMMRNEKHLYDQDDDYTDHLPDLLDENATGLSFITLQKKVFDWTQNPKQDHKIEAVVKKVQELLAQDHAPIIFCRYISTAQYVERILTEKLKKTKVMCVTSELDDQQRQEKISELSQASRRVLVATDCLSEGVNLQENFNAVIHYDLPWNPNRLEQREGRVDRFGQPRTDVKTFLVYGENNPMDGVLLNVLLRKAIEIKKSLGIAVPFPADSQSVMEAMMQAVLMKSPQTEASSSKQLSLWTQEDLLKEQEKSIQKAIDLLVDEHHQFANLFSNTKSQLKSLEDDLKEIDISIGNVDSLKDFILGVFDLYSSNCVQEIQKGIYEVDTVNLSHVSNIPEIRNLLQLNNQSRYVKITFNAPHPQDVIYIGRNHPLTETLAQRVISSSSRLNRNFNESAFSRSRASVLVDQKIQRDTVFLCWRVRNVVSEKIKQDEHYFVAEELILSSYAFDGQVPKTISEEQSSKTDLIDLLQRQQFLLKDQLMSLESTKGLDQSQTETIFQKAIGWLKDETLRKKYADELAILRSKKLIQSHQKYQKLMGKTTNMSAVEPILPLDLMGIYVVLTPTSTHLG